ncbi:MAG: hypothetical protein QOC73_410 [Actinomycetota bacterium]|nr:hypothetical protein [Actinomycetota bacterium]
MSRRMCQLLQTRFLTPAGNPCPHNDRSTGIASGNDPIYVPFLPCVADGRALAFAGALPVDLEGGEHPMAEGEQKFRLAWRPHEPVLDYALWGYWSTADARAWKAAISSEIGRRPAGTAWFMVGDLSALKPQPDDVNAIRDEVTQFALAGGLGGCVMYGITGVTLLQLRRLLGASGRAENFAYTETSTQAEQQLRRWMSAKTAHPGARSEP